MSVRLLVTLLFVVLGWARPAMAQEQAQEEAKTHFQRGLELVDTGRFEDASIEFESAYELSPRPAVLYNMGMAQAAARRPSLALQAFVRYLELSGETLDPKRRSDVRARMATLRAQLATIKVSSQPPDSVIQIDGSAAKDPQAVLVDPGSHVVAASAPGHAEASRTVVLRSGESLGIDLILAPLPKPPASPALALPASNPSRRSAARPDSRAGAMRDAQLAHDREQARSRRIWVAAGTALGGVLLAGTTTALIVDNRARYARWREEQTALDKQWLSAAPEAGPTGRQATNDQLANRIKLQDEGSVGVGVASAACLIAAAVVWFAGGEEHASPPKVAWSPRRNGAELGFVW